METELICILWSLNRREWFVVATILFYFDVYKFIFGISLILYYFFFQLLRHQFLSDLVASVLLWRSVGSIKRREVYRRPINRL